MSRALVVGTSARATPGRKKVPTVASLVAGSVGPTPPPPAPRARAALKRTAPSASTRTTSGPGASSAGPSSIRKKAKAESAGTSAPKRRARKISTDTAGPVSPAAKAAKEEKPEKRLARYLAFPSTATNERITRAFQHRLYLIDKKLVGNDPSFPSSCEFNVLGSTGNVYEVKLQQRPSCTCPDFPRSGLCKHVLFVMLRVLKLDRNDPRVWQKALLTSELNELLEISATSDGELASQIVRQRFQEIQKGSGKLEEGASADVQSKPIQRDIAGDCPICYEKMDDGNGKAKEPVVFCRVCGNNVHRDCFEKWSRSKSSSGGQTTCIYCRAVWSDGVETKKAKFSSDYVNLADVSDAHRHQHSSLEELYPESHQWIGYNGRRRRGRGR